MTSYKNKLVTKPLPQTRTLMRKIPHKSLDWVVLALRLLGQDYPALESDLQLLLSRLERKFGRRDLAQDDAAILRAIRDGYCTARDIAERMAIPYVTVIKRLTALEQAGIVYHTRQANSEPGAGGDRKTKLFWLAKDWQALYRQRLASAQPAQLELFRR